LADDAAANDGGNGGDTVSKKRSHFRFDALSDLERQHTKFILISTRLILIPTVNRQKHKTKKQRTSDVDFTTTKSYSVQQEKKKEEIRKATKQQSLSSSQMRVALLVSAIVVLSVAAMSSGQHCGPVNQLIKRDDMCWFFYKQFNTSSLFYVLPEENTLINLTFQGRLRTEGTCVCFPHCSYSSAVKFLFMTGIKLLPAECRSAALALTCSGTFLPCVYHQIPNCKFFLDQKKTLIRDQLLSTNHVCFST